MFWKEVDEARFDEMLGVVPPRVQMFWGFLVGEPVDHDPETGRARYDAFVTVDRRFYGSLSPITVAEFRAVQPATVPNDVPPPVKVLGLCAIWKTRFPLPIGWTYGTVLDRDHAVRIIVKGGAVSSEEDEPWVRPDPPDAPWLEKRAPARPADQHDDTPSLDTSFHDHEMDV